MTDALLLPPFAAERLVCPETHLPIRLCSRGEAESLMGSPLVPRAEARNAKDRFCPPVGATPWVLLREDLACAYPIVDGHPILLVPEMLTPQTGQRRFDLRDPRYAEAYEEMEFYNEAADQEAARIGTSELNASLGSVLGSSAAARDSFPDPKEVWIDAVYDCAAQWEAYHHLGPIRGKRTMQLGGKGGHAVKFLLAGAGEAWTLSPMVGEARHARALARAAGVEDGLFSVVAIAEEIPLAADTVDSIYSGGCLHHTSVPLVMREVARILRRGGAFAAADPWRAPLYAIGTSLLGKREPDVYCRPLTRARIEPVWEAFPKADLRQHGTLTRYPLLALNKLGLSCSLSTAWWLNSIDDRICSMIPGLRGWGSSVALLCRKSA